MESDLEIDFSESDSTTSLVPKMNFIDPPSPDVQGDWKQMREAETDEIVFINEKQKRVYYPMRNNGQGEIWSMSGKLIEKCTEDSDSEIEDIKPKIRSKFDKVRCKIVATYEKPKKLPDMKVILFSECFFFSFLRDRKRL